jgi:hypothetical protein
LSSMVLYGIRVNNRMLLVYSIFVLDFTDVDE